ncbi:MAG: DUF4054 domain-containing protein [Lachnospiraceae bacterium]|nr:DUF4054 domain-containing protein [Lachnospiraceae bacterium]
MDAFDIIKATMKEFSDVPEPDIKVYIELSAPLVSKKRFGNLYEQAVAYLAAHRMKMDGRGATVGGFGSMGNMVGISSISEGEVSVSFTNSQSSSASSSDSELGLSVYGMQFLQLRRSCIVPILCSGEVPDNG